MTWATIDDVDDLTGVSCTAQDIRRAVATLETVTGLFAGSDETVTIAAGTDFITITRDGDTIRARGRFVFGSPGQHIELPAWAAPSMVTATTTDSMTCTAIPAGLVYPYPALGFNNGVGNVNAVWITRAAHGIGGPVRTDISDRDRRWLKLMTVYQVAFMLDNPDLFSRNDVTSAGQDGESASFRNVDSHLFAPLARKAFRRLSWAAKTLLSPVGGSGALPLTGRDVNSEEFDDALPWVQM